MKNVCLYYCLTYPTCKLHLFHAALCSHVWPVWPAPHFPTLSYKRYDFRTNTVFLNIKSNRPMKSHAEYFWGISVLKFRYNACPELLLSSVRWFLIKWKQFHSLGFSQSVHMKKHFSGPQSSVSGFDKHSFQHQMLRASVQQDFHAFIFRLSVRIPGRRGQYSGCERAPCSLRQMLLG